MIRQLYIKKQLKFFKSQESHEIGDVHGLLGVDFSKYKCEMITRFCYHYPGMADNSFVTLIILPDITKM